MSRLRVPFPVVLLSLLLGLFCPVRAVFNTGIQLRIDEFFEAPGHTNNWAIIVDSSKFWHNYRHVSSVLAVYRSVKRLGIPDSNIILMIGEQVPCNARNPKPATSIDDVGGQNVFGTDVEVDYRGDEVSVENFIRLLTGRHHANTPRNKRLLTNHQSNVLIYLNGHGADGFIKFRDFEELTSVELAYALQTMYEDNRYHEVFLIADSCRSASMYEWITSPNVLASSSSLTSENSYSYELDYDLGVFVNDRFSYYTTKFLNKEVEGFNTSKSLQDFLDSCSFDKCKSTIGVLTDLYPKDLRKVRVTDFFGSARIVKHLTEEITLDDNFWRTPETF